MPPILTWAAFSVFMVLLDVLLDHASPVLLDSSSAAGEEVLPADRSRPVATPRTSAQWNCAALA
ncbi:hypothetical protein U9R90_01075 [Streptomyces sp. E11-3]|uniref:hypothetical protein n=1 Tax=Streptomyces sp. E11-3 TaxID=3110112 RepID=UPI0039818583